MSDNNSSPLNASFNASNANAGFIFVNPITPDILAAYNAYLYTVIALGIPGNIIVLTVFIYQRALNTTEWFILFITLYDLLSSLFNVPVYVSFTNGIWKNYGTEFICQFHMFFSQTVVLSSTFLITGLAIDRYWKVCRPMSTLVTNKRARNSCLAITVATMLMSLPCFVMYRNVNGRCVSIAMGDQLFAYYTMVFATFCLATLAVILSYIFVSRAIYTSESKLINHDYKNPFSTTAQNKHFSGCCWMFKSNRGNKVFPGMSTDVDTNKTILVSSIKVKSPNQNAINQQEDQRPSTLQVPVTYNKRTNKLSQDSSTNSTVMSADTGTSSGVNAAINNKRNIRKSMRITRISFLVCFVFVISWIPPWLCLFLAASPSHAANPRIIKFMFFGRMTNLVNTVLNPFLYAGLNSKFRQQLTKIFSCK